MGKRRRPQTKRQLREADRLACERKQVYGTRAEAEKTERNLFHKGIDVGPYKYSACGLWHLGHRNKRKR